MQECMIYHTGVDECAKGIIKEGLVYLLGDENQLYFPEEMFMAREECECGLIQFEVEGKWGFAEIYTGEIKIPANWEYAGPFYSGYAHVVAGAQLERYGSYRVETHGGKHGYIDKNGTVIIPVEYDAAEEIPYRQFFKVALNGKWGLVDNQNRIVIPLEWDVLETRYYHDLIFGGIEEACDSYVGPEDKLLESMFNIPVDPTCRCRLKWGVYDPNFNLIVSPELDDKPMPYKKKGKANCHDRESSYYLLKRKRKRKYGVLCTDGRLITNITLLKRDAANIIDKLSE